MVCKCKKCNKSLDVIDYELDIDCEGDLVADIKMTCLDCKQEYQVKEYYQLGEPDLVLIDGEEVN